MKLLIFSLGRGANFVLGNYHATDLIVADDLIEAGIPQEEIVLGFHPESIRPLTGFAVK